MTEDQTNVKLSQLKAGPLGLGDPEDKDLRKVEIEVLIPKIMREKAQTEKCPDEVKLFTQCCKENSVAMVWKCRKENSELKECLMKWYTNDNFRNECTQDYLRIRSEFRRTGLTKIQKKFITENQNS